MPTTSIYIHFEFCSEILYQQLVVSISAPGELPYFSFNPNQTHLEQLIKVFMAT